MTDSLTRLAERALGVATVIKPRAISTFDPASEGAPAPVVEEVHELQETDLAKPRTHREAGEGFTPQTSEAAVPDLRLGKSASPEPEPSTDSARDIKERESVRVGHAGDAERGSGPSGRPADPFRHSVGEPRGSPQRVGPVLASPAQSTQLAALGERRMSGGADRQMLAIARPEAEPLARLTRKPQRAEPRNDVTPTVRVTIGRVEVRAVFEPPQVPTPREAPGAMLSLETYLKQRREGLR